HLDRPFDYLIPPEFHHRVQVGSRVKVKFAGRKLNGYVFSITDTTERPEKIAPLIDVVGDVAVVTPEIFALARVVADRWVGSLVDILRSAIVPRHAKTEAQVLEAIAQAPVAISDVHESEVSQWLHYRAGFTFLEHLRNPNATPARAVITTAPGHDSIHLAADAIQIAAAHRKGVIAIVPDRRDLTRLTQLLTQRISKEAFVVLTSDVGPAPRYRAFLQALRGETRIVIGTRSAALAPMADLGLVILVDDGDDSLAEQHSPSWHAREVLALRSLSENCSLLALSSSRSVETQSWIESGWAIDLETDRALVRSTAPTVRATSDSELAQDPVARAARLPHMVFATIREGLKTGPVLLQVPRRGYQLNLACARCRHAVHCAECQGPLALPKKDGIPYCMWCGASAGAFSCPWCQGTSIRSAVIGAARTAEEIGRAFPDIPIRTSGKDNILDVVDDVPSLVISTPGAEPRVKSGFYAAAAILDAELSLHRVDLRTEEESLRRWQHVVSLVKPVDGRVAVVGMDSDPTIQALIRHDPVGFAHHELSQRTAARMLPAWSVTEIICVQGEWLKQKSTAHFESEVLVLGPVPIVPVQPGELLERVLVCSPRGLASHTARELRAIVGLRSSKKLPGTFSVRVDPVHLR
ncbi:MAG: hypothetical protein RIS75_1379, partial [Actinomycetota bacterium]